MAFVPDGLGNGHWLSLSVQDRNMDVVTLQYELRATSDLEVGAEVDAILAAFDDVSQAVVVGYIIQQRLVNDSIGIPSAGENEIKARISYQEKDSFHKGTFDIPAPKETIFHATTGKQNKIVNVGNSAVMAYADLFRAAGVARIGGGKDLEFLLEGRKVSSRKGLRSS